jgi:hypothetical protein
MKAKLFLNIVGIAFIAYLFIAATHWSSGNKYPKPITVLTYQDCIESHAANYCICADLFGRFEPECEIENDF